jgi:glycerol-3-phosphate acyltransferase PlsY
MIFLVFAAAYLIGSIPFALMAGFILTKEDIREKGSGNAGATNVYRILGRQAAIFVLSADFLKAFLPVFYAAHIYKSQISGTMAVELFQLTVLVLIIIGHAFPVFARFRGGKGMACAAGGISAFFPPAIPFCLFIFIGTIALTKYVSLASLLTALLLPVYYFLFTVLTDRILSLYSLVLFIMIALLIILLHRKNIKRLIRKEEPRMPFGTRKSEDK